MRTSQRQQRTNLSDKTAVSVAELEKQFLQPSPVPQAKKPPSSTEHLPKPVPFETKVRVSSDVRFVLQAHLSVSESDADATASDLTTDHAYWPSSSSSKVHSYLRERESWGDVSDFSRIREFLPAHVSWHRQISRRYNRLNHQVNWRRCSPVHWRFTGTFHP